MEIVQQYQRFNTVMVPLNDSPITLMKEIMLEQKLKDAQQTSNDTAKQKRHNNKLNVPTIRGT